jgi:hypothetical protein
MNIIDVLLGEHGLLYAQFDRVEGEAPRLDRLSLLRAEADLLITSLKAHLNPEGALLCARMTLYVKRQPEAPEGRRARACEIAWALPSLLSRSVDATFKYRREARRFETPKPLGQPPELTVAGGPPLKAPQVGAQPQHALGRSRHRRFNTFETSPGQRHVQLRGVRPDVCAAATTAVEAARRCHDERLEGKERRVSILAGRQ